MARPRLGDILLGMEAIDPLQLQSAVGYQRQWGTPLGKVLVDKGFCTEEQVLAALARQTGFPIAELDKEKLDPIFARLLPQRIAEKHQVIPLRVEGKRQEVLVVAIAAPASLASLDAVRSVSGKQRVVPLLASDSAIQAAIKVLYEGADENEFAALTPFLNAPVPEEEEEYLLTEPIPNPVFIFGWPEQAAQGIALTLATEGFEARVVGPREVLGCIADDVIVAPLPAIEAVLAAGQKLRGYP